MWALHMCCCCSISAAANGVVQIALEAQVFHVFHMQKKKKILVVGTSDVSRMT